MRREPASFRSGLPVLVVHAESLGALAVIRSLGRAGYPVHAASSDPSALGLRSAYATSSVLTPPYGSAEYVPFIRRLVSRFGIRAVVPSESFLLAVQGQFADFAGLFPLAPDARTLYAGLSKFHVAAALEDLAAANLPETLLVPDTRELPSIAALRALGTPLYVKVDGLASRLGENGLVRKATSAEEALESLRELAPRFSRALVQGHVEGRGVGAFFLMKEGAPLAEFMHRRIHEVPHTGGVSSLRESFFDPAIREDALEKLQALKWSGVAMLEYRREPSGRFWFIELNGRFWGSLHLALHAGVDFPRLLLDAHFGEMPEQGPAFPIGLRCRHTFPADVQHLWSKLRDRAVPSLERMRAIGEFAALSLDPRVRADLLYPGDRLLYLHGLRDFLKSVVVRERRDTHAPHEAARVRGREAFGPVRAVTSPDARGPSHPLPPRHRHP